MWNVSTNVCAKFHCASLRIKKALGIFSATRRRTTTRVAFWDPPSLSSKCEDRERQNKNQIKNVLVVCSYLHIWRKFISKSIACSITANYLRRRLVSGEGIVSLGVRYAVCACVSTALVSAEKVMRYIQCSLVKLCEGESSRTLELKEVIINE